MIRSSSKGSIDYEQDQKVPVEHQRNKRSFDYQFSYQEKAYRSYKQIFPEILYDILMNSEHHCILSFLPDGKAWKVHDKKRFESEIMSVYFETNKWASFLRQVNGWGFQRVNAEEAKNFDARGSYWHKDFGRNQIDTVSSMRRIGHNKNDGKSVRSLGIERSLSCSSSTSASNDGKFSTYEKRGRKFANNHRSSDRSSRVPRLEADKDIYSIDKALPLQQHNSSSTSLFQQSLVPITLNTNLSFSQCVASDFSINLLPWTSNTRNSNTILHSLYTDKNPRPCSGYSVTSIVDKNNSMLQQLANVAALQAIHNNRGLVNKLTSSDLDRLNVIHKRNDYMSKGFK